MGTATGIIRALNSGVKHLAVKRFTLKYPEEKLKFVGDGYQYDPTTGVGVAGLKGRHMLFHDHCTGCPRSGTSTPRRSSTPRQYGYSTLHESCITGLSRCGMFVM